MYRSFRLIERTEEYCLYDYTVSGYSDSQRQIIYWFEDQSIKLYEKLVIERQEQDIIALFLRYVADKDFPEETEIFTIKPQDALQFYDEYLKGVLCNLQRMLESEQGKVLDAINRPSAQKEIIEETVLWYREILKKHYEQGLRFYQRQAIDTVPGEPVSDPELQPMAYEIEKMFFETGKVFQERLYYLQMLADQLRKPPFLRTAKSLYEWNEQQSRQAGYSHINELRTSDEHLQYMPEEREPEKKEMDLVNYTILSPKAVQPDSYGIVECYMYTDPDRQKVDNAIQNNDELVKKPQRQALTSAETPR